jgi:hypothetical protein
MRMVKTLHNHYNPLSTFKENSSYWTPTQLNGTEAYSQNFSPAFESTSPTSSDTVLYVRPARFL